jgi:hypothetical protein
MENDFFYNDETHELFTEPGTCSQPQRIFLNRAEAETFALEIAHSHLRGYSLSFWGMYGGDLIAFLADCWRRG